MCPLGELIEPRLVLLGGQKVGKSSMASVLLAGKLKAPNLPFKTTSAAKCISKTATQFAEGNWIGKKEQFTIIDTPGKEHLHIRLLSRLL